MGTLNAKIAKAVRILWVDKETEKGREALTMLQEAAEEGNPDCRFRRFVYKIPCGKCVLLR